MHPCVQAYCADRPTATISRSAREGLPEAEQAVLFGEPAVTAAIDGGVGRDQILDACSMERLQTITDPAMRMLAHNARARGHALHRQLGRAYEQLAIIRDCCRPDLPAEVLIVPLVLEAWLVSHQGNDRRRRLLLQQVLQLLPQESPRFHRNLINLCYAMAGAGELASIPDHQLHLVEADRGPRRWRGLPWLAFITHLNAVCTGDRQASLAAQRSLGRGRKLDRLRDQGPYQHFLLARFLDDCAHHSTDQDLPQVPAHLTDGLASYSASYRDLLQCIVKDDPAQTELARSHRQRYLLDEAVALCVDQLSLQALLNAEQFDEVLHLLDEDSAAGRDSYLAGFFRAQALFGLGLRQMAAKELRHCWHACRSRQAQGALRLVCRLQRRLDAADFIDLLAAADPHSLTADTSLPASATKPGSLTGRQLLGRLSKQQRQERIMNFLRQHGRMTRREAINLLGASPNTVTTDLRELHATGGIKRVEPTSSTRTHYFTL